MLRSKAEQKPFFGTKQTDGFVWKDIQSGGRAVQHEVLQWLTAVAKLQALIEKVAVCLAVALQWLGSRVLRVLLVRV